MGGRIEQCRSNDGRTCIRHRHPRLFHSTEHIGDTTTGVVHERLKKDLDKCFVSLHA